MLRTTSLEQRRMKRYLAACDHITVHSALHTSVVARAFGDAIAAKVALVYFGQTVYDDIDRVRAIRKSRLVEVSEGQPAPGDWPACLVANENYANFRAMLVRTNPKCERLVLTAAELDALKCNAGDTVRLVRLCPEEKTA